MKERELIQSFEQLAEALHDAQRQRKNMANTIERCKEVIVGHTKAIAVLTKHVVKMRKKRKRTA